MKILHICNDYCYSKVHRELYSELDALGVQQVVYTYPLEQRFVGANRFDGERTEFVYSNVHKHYHKYLFHKKISDVTKDVERQVDMKSIDCIHATTLFSDGGVALALHKKYGTPYVVAVRNTDVNEYMGYAPHTWLMGKEVLRKANKLVFISPSIHRHFCRHFFFKGVAQESLDKTVICPNGINRYWLEHLTPQPTASKRDVLYIGRFDNNKNVLRLIEAFLLLQREMPDTRLHIVGERGEQEAEIKRMADEHESIAYHGAIYDREQLRDIMRQSGIFAMTSIFETFGLVYIEAMSQGLPILFTRGQGVDGYFSERIGVSVNPKDVKDIAAGLRELIENHDSYDGYKHIDFGNFDWQRIAERYKTIIFNTHEKLPPPASRA